MKSTKGRHRNQPDYDPAKPGRSTLLTTLPKPKRMPKMPHVVLTKITGTSPMCAPTKVTAKALKKALKTTKKKY